MARWACPKAPRKLRGVLATGAQALGLRFEERACRGLLPQEGPLGPLCLITGTSPARLGSSSANVADWVGAALWRGRGGHRQVETWHVKKFGMKTEVAISCGGGGKRMRASHVVETLATREARGAPIETRREEVRHGVDAVRDERVSPTP